MAWADGFIAVDWGTTNRRGYLLDPGGRLTDEMEDDRGILAVGRHGFDAAVAELKGRLGERPLLMAGMIGSNRGWVEAPYVPCPAGLPELAANLKWVVRDRIAIVPGVSYRDNERADVMRGEEVQLLGAYAEGLVGADALICHPGTHNKWARLRDGRITEFRTIMTGELFNLLREHSILSELLAGPSTPPAASLRINSAAPDAAFEAGVRHGLTHDDLQAELFSIRARVLLGAARREEAASYTSGLLIGSDLRIGLRDAPPGPVVAMGRPELTRLFAAALALAGREAQEIDGETAFLAGIRHIAELVQ